MNAIDKRKKCAHELSDVYITTNNKRITVFAMRLIGEINR